MRCSPFGGKRDLTFLAGQDIDERAGEVGADPVQLQDVRQDRDTQQTQCLPVLLVYEASLVDDDDARLYGVKNKLVIFLLLDGLRFRFRKDLGDLRESLADQSVVGRATGHGVLEGEVVIVDRIEHEGDFTAVLAVKHLKSMDGDRIANSAGNGQKPMFRNNAISAYRREDEQHQYLEVLIIYQSGKHGDNLFYNPKRFILL